jgi:hypothetical protein
MRTTSRPTATVTVVPFAASPIVTCPELGAVVVVELVTSGVEVVVVASEV